MEKEERRPWKIKNRFYHNMLTEKFKPRNIKEVIGQDSAIIKLKECIGKKQVALIYGKAGVGKTSSVYAIANELNFEVVELNASDFRNKEGIDKIVGNSLKQKSLFFKGKIILIDEVDGISGNEDRGGVAALASLLDEVNFPVVLVANDPWSSKLSSLRRKCKLIEFIDLNYVSISNILKKVCSELKIKYNDEDLKTLARRSGGDLRAALNDLERVYLDYNEVSKESINILDDREKKESIFNVLNIILKTKNAEDSLNAFDKLDINIDEAFLWIDENVGREYQDEDLYNAYESLSKSDVFNGRIRRWQYWRFLVYRIALMTAGVSVSKKEKYSFFKYQRSGRLLKIWMANQRNKKKKSIAFKMKKSLHMSGNRIVKEVFPYVCLIVKRNKDFNLGLEKEDLDYLKELKTF